MQHWSQLVRFGVACLLAVVLPNPGHSASLPGMAVAQFDYVDTSGEVRDQRAEHARRIQEFSKLLRDGLAASGKFAVVDMNCPADGCTMPANDPAALTDAARKAGATYLVFGGIHKESTLVQWAKIIMVNIGDDKIVFDRLVTFRGDDDAAWHHAAVFVVRNMLDQSSRQ